MRKNIKFVFGYPPAIFGLYDTGEGTIYVFGNYCEDDIEGVIAHESLHFVLQKVIGASTSLMLDNIPRKILTFK